MQAVSRRLHQARELLDAAAEQTAALQRSMRQHDYALNWEAAQALLDSGPNRPAWSALQGGAEHLLEQLRDSTSAARLHDTLSAAGRQLQHTDRLIGALDPASPNNVQTHFKLCPVQQPTARVGLKSLGLCVAATGGRSRPRHVNTLICRQSHLLSSGGRTSALAGERPSTRCPATRPDLPHPPGLVRCNGCCDLEPGRGTPGHPLGVTPALSSRSVKTSVYVVVIARMARVRVGICIGR